MLQATTIFFGWITRKINQPATIFGWVTVTLFQYATIFGWVTVTLFQFRPAAGQFSANLLGQLCAMAPVFGLWSQFLAVCVHSSPFLSSLWTAFLFIVHIPCAPRSAGNNGFRGCTRVFNPTNNDLPGDSFRPIYAICASCLPLEHRQFFSAPNTVTGFLRISQCKGRRRRKFFLGKGS